MLNREACCVVETFGRWHQYPMGTLGTTKPYSFSGVTVYSHVNIASHIGEIGTVVIIG